MTEPRDDVALLRGLLAKAPDLPWLVSRPRIFPGREKPLANSGSVRAASGAVICSIRFRDLRPGVEAANEAKAAFIVAAVNAPPGLLDDRERLERAEKALANIDHVLSSGERTDDELVRDAGYALDYARAALQPSSEEQG